MRFVHDISEMWTNPSMPGSSFTNAPYVMMLTTSPLCRLLTGYLACTFCHGLGCLCLSERDLLLLLVDLENVDLEFLIDLAPRRAGW